MDDLLKCHIPFHIQLNFSKFAKNDNSKEFQKMIAVYYLGKRKHKVRKVNKKFTLTDEQLSIKLSDNAETYQSLPCNKEDYENIADSHRPQLSNGLERWL